MRAGADAGGTFTDVVGADGRIAKVLSSPDDPGRAVRGGVAAVAGSQHLSLLAHGTTIATNAVLEGTGAPVALVTTDGPSRPDRDRPPGPAVALRQPR